MYRFAVTYGEDVLPKPGEWTKASAAIVSARVGYELPAMYCSEPRELYEVDINEIIKFTFIGSSHTHLLETNMGHRRRSIRT